MLVCGVELTAKEAVICLLGLKQGAFNVADCRTRQFALPKQFDTQDIRDFHFAFQKLMQDYGVDEVVIIERQPKGKFAGSAISFKLETAIQLQELPVTLIGHTTMKEQLKRNPVQADYEELGLKKFQLTAFQAAYAFHNEKLYPQDPE